ncbi:hypothetical protein PR202_gb29124 [Eleusine coracana subsp. coracana]|uniref:Uncharacterized protein n=1 Tax=Eleusine coracana subsp. coracana TaxID=191504 RepID=A0AAV5FZ30_ELECO|nr:hypothetical protein QOZ80_2BG0176720 [Eleusine coracana subsp. coracana]GJN39967.1 hypothetical protein PR202_gb29124 [Eleusine coracana subsp. coracana]
MSSMGFSYAQIHVRRERCKKAVQEKEKKANKKAAFDGGEKEVDKRAAIADETTKAAAGGSWASVRVHPSAGTAAQNGGR